MAISEQIKRDLKKAVGKSGVLEGDFLDNIEWLFKTVNKDNFEDFPDPVPVGKLRPEVQKAIGVSGDVVYLKPRVYAKIRGWWRNWLGHPELGDDFYYLLPLALYFPTRVLADKHRSDTFLIVSEFVAKGWIVVVELITEAALLEVKTMFLINVERIEKEYETIWFAGGNKETLPGGLADPSVLAPRHQSLSASDGVAGARFPSLQESTLDASNIRRLCQEDVFLYSKLKLPLDDTHLEHPADLEHGDYASNLALAKFEELPTTNYQLLITAFLSSQRIGIGFVAGAASSRCLVTADKKNKSD